MDVEGASAIVHLDEWTREQQLEEVKRRIDIFESISQSTVTSTAKFTPLSSDVICVAPPKSGTTWFTHICHQIRMQGAEPTFEKQTDVVCWIEMCKATYGIDPRDVVQPGGFRIFAIHTTNYETIPKSDKTVYLFRDQMDALYSNFKMRDSLFMLRGRVSLSVYATIVLKSGLIQEWLEDLVVWWERRHQKNILFLFYEDLKEDHAGSVRRIADFLGVECNDDIIGLIVETTTHKEMSKISFKFDSAARFPDLAKQIGEDPILVGDDHHVGRVRKDGGRSGDGRKNLTPEVQESFKQLWREVVTSKLGFESLQDMRQARMKELCT